jgi:hypothetical protein
MDPLPLPRPIQRDYGSNLGDRNTTSTAAELVDTQKVPETAVEEEVPPEETPGETQNQDADGTHTRYQGLFAILYLTLVLFLSSEETPCTENATPSEDENQNVEDGAHTSCHGLFAILFLTLVFFPSSEDPPSNTGNENHALCCHTDLTALREVDGAYFAEGYTLPVNFPLRCSKCKKRFVTGKGSAFDKQTMVKLTKTTTAKACPNAILHCDHPCLFALCPICYKAAELERIEKEDSEKSKKRGRSCGPNSPAVSRQHRRSRTSVTPSP